MTKQIARREVDFLDFYLQNHTDDYSAESHMAMMMAIDALKSSENLNNVLDKIKAEIKALSPEPTAYDVVDGNPVKDAIWETLIEVDKIIDKYKTESEDKNGNREIHN